MKNGKPVFLPIPELLQEALDTLPRRRLLEKGWTTEDVALVLGSTPDIIRRHYAQWTIQRQERISSLAQDVWDVRFLSGSKIRL